MEMAKLNKHLTFSTGIEAADSERRIIAGQIVPFGVVGQTSAGAVIFERGSIQIPAPSKIKLLAQHDKSASGVIGRAQSFQETNDGINGVFKVSASKDGENMLIKASEQLLDGLSVGVDVIRASERKDGTLIVSSAILREVSLVETPAFDAARVNRVAAEAGDVDEIAEEALETAEDVLIQQISDAADGLKAIQEAEKALEESETQSESEAMMSQDTPAATTEAAAAPVAAEASRPTIKASVPYSTQSVRHGITSAGKYVEHKIKASLGDAESALWIAASEDPTSLTASTDSIGTTNPAFNPIQYLSNFVSNTNFGRSAIDAVTKAALPSSGMTINIPSLVTSAGGGSSTAPTVAETGEDVAPSSTGMTSAYESVTVKKFAGSQVITLELIERSDPVFFDQLAIQLKRAYDKATDEYMVAVLGTGTQATVASGTTAADFQNFVAVESAAAYSGSSYFASNLIVSPQWWSKLQSYADTTGRPIYTLASPQFNAAGQVTPTSIKGSALGLDVYVDRYVVGATNTGLADDSMFIVAPETAYWWESPTAFFSVNHVADATGNMALQTAIYGYGAGKVTIPAGVRRFNI